MGGGAPKGALAFLDCDKSKIRIQKAVAANPRLVATRDGGCGCIALWARALGVMSQMRQGRLIPGNSGLQDSSTGASPEAIRGFLLNADVLE